jgi:DNA-binding transcriptional LysR family regulator
LYEETFVIAGPAATVGTRASWSWRDAAKLPLCLLTPNMRHRHLLDEAFRKAGAKPNVVAEMNSLFGILAHLFEGPFCAILPASSVPAALHSGVLAVRPMQGRAAGHPVGLIVPRRDPLPPRSAALMSVALAAGEP